MSGLCCEAEFLSEIIFVQSTSISYHIRVFFRQHRTMDFGSSFVYMYDEMGYEYISDDEYEDGMQVR